MDRDVVIGDVHGCLEELDELLRVLEYTSRDRLVFVGDLVDRGPDSVGVVRRVRELGAICVMGNHDEWYPRFRRAEARGKNTMKKLSHKIALYPKLGDDNIDWLEKLPLYYRLGPRKVVVHAGLIAGVPLEQQERDDLLRLRYVDRRTGKRWNMSSEELLTPDVAAYWTELWRGPEEVIYGHHPSKTGTIHTMYEGIRGWGIDTGCCFGNKLTAWVSEWSDSAGTRVIKYVSVPARAQYAKWHHAMRD